MKKIALGVIGAVAALSVAAPAYAADGKVRAEVRGGAIFGGGESEVTFGGAAGYDYKMGDLAFVGAEISADKALSSGTKVFLGLSGRMGASIGVGTIFAAGGYTFAEGENVPHIGAGYEQSLALNLYAKAEYRHFFSDYSDADSLTVGVGMKF